MKIISWNIDSINAALTSDSDRAKMTRETLQALKTEGADFICIQETKLSKLLPAHKKGLEELFPEYHIMNSISTTKKGYAGTMILSKHDVPWDTPKITNGELEDIDGHGRITHLEHDDFHLVNVYTPNAGGQLKNLDSRVLWDRHFSNYLAELNKDKPVIVCGDLNVARTEIDLARPKGAEKYPGFSPEERSGFEQTLEETKFTDVFRLLNPDKTDVYTWWSQTSKSAKENNVGWRIDYFLISPDFPFEIKGLGVGNTGKRGDHAPLMFEFN